MPIHYPGFRREMNTSNTRWIHRRSIYLSLVLSGVLTGMMWHARENAPRMHRSRWTKLPICRHRHDTRQPTFKYPTFARAILKIQFILWLPCFLAWLHAKIPLFGKPSSVFHTTGSIQPGIGESYLRQTRRPYKNGKPSGGTCCSTWAAIATSTCLLRHLSVFPTASIPELRARRHPYFPSVFYTLLSDQDTDRKEKTIE